MTPVHSYLLSLQSLLQLEPHGLVGTHHPGSHHICTGVSHATHSTHAREAAALAHLGQHGPKATLLGLALHGVPPIGRLHGHGRRSGVALSIKRLLVKDHGGVLSWKRLQLLLCSLALGQRGENRTRNTGLSNFHLIDSFPIHWLCNCLFLSSADGSLWAHLLLLIEKNGLHIMTHG